jgi:hypothetical protein
MLRPQRPNALVGANDDCGSSMKVVRLTNGEAMKFVLESRENARAGNAEMRREAVDDVFGKAAVSF